jgi:hydroxyacylglutathione hydrolase
MRYKIKSFLGGYDGNFTYVVYNDSKCCVLDLGVSSDVIFDFVKEKGLKIEFVVFLHSHFDHVVDLEVYRSKGIEIYGHESSEIKKDRGLVEGDVIGFDDVEIKVLHTPGHRFDSVCLMLEDDLFTSDTLFVEGVGRVDFEGSDPKVMFETLQRLKLLGEMVKVYPGHDYGSVEVSTIGYEKKHNRFFRMSYEEFLRNR